MNSLKIGSSLQGDKYTITAILGQGGFGITYLATQNVLNRPVAIKEFFFKDLCDRDETTNSVTTGNSVEKETVVERYLNKFIKEARTISTLEHPCIVSIHDVFRENNTAYYVMDYVDGVSLEEYCKQNGVVPEDVAIEWIRSVCDAISYIHGLHINHLDIKPSNIMVRNKDNRIVLIDFGLSKHYEADGSQTTTTPVGISHGYAPFEQYQVGGVSSFSPQTDIYSIGATLYRLVVGKRPPEPSEIMHHGLPEFPQHLSQKCCNAITAAMKLKRLERPSSIAEFVALLPSKETVSPQPQPVTPVEKGTSIMKNKMLWIVVAIAIIIVAGLSLVSSGKDDKKSTETTVTMPTSPKVDKSKKKEKRPIASPKEKKISEPTDIKQESKDPVDEAFSQSDYATIEKLADQGNLKACEKMADYYMAKASYDLADRYATKAYNMGSKHAVKVIDLLKSLGYYDDKE